VDDTFVVWPHRSILEPPEQPPFIHKIHDGNRREQPDTFFGCVGDTGQRPASSHRKKTHSDRYLNAQSQHHPQQKRALMKTLFHRAETICDEDSKERELKHIKWALKCNGFSDRDIRFARKVRQHTEQQSYQKFACLPYVQGVTDRIRNLFGEEKHWNQVYHGKENLSDPSNT
jgi:hypothetical protein